MSAPRLLAVLLVLGHSPLGAQLRFSDDFDGDLSGWELVGAQAITIRETNDAVHGRVLALQPDDAVFALIKDSDQWGAVRIEGEVLFPDDDDNYLGVMYNYVSSGQRTDFGSLYIKGNGSYIRANPWRDGNVSRLLYEEFMTPLTGDDAIRIGEWKRFKAEIRGSMCHFYVGDMSTPKVTFDLFEGSSGLVGFGPRVVGTPVWIDNVRVTSIDRLGYVGPNIPDIRYEPDSLITSWETLGPLEAPIVAVEHAGGVPSTIRDGGVEHRWRPLPVDARGAVVTGRVSEFHGPRSVAYFRTTIYAEADTTMVLHISTTDELALWVNGRFAGYYYRNGYLHDDWNAWHDFWKNPAREGRRGPLRLRRGENAIVLRVRNGQFASGGFFARLQS